MTMAVNICIQASLLFLRLQLTKNMIDLRIPLFAEKVLWPIFKVTLLSVAVPAACAHLMPGGWVRLLVVSAVSVAVSALCIMRLGMSRHERAYIVGMAQKALHKIKHQ